MRPTVMLLAGEASGDECGAALAKALRARGSELRLVGAGGPLMEGEGVELFARLDDLAVMGFAEVLPKLFFFRRLERMVATRLSDPSLRLVIPIDYPGFNMRVTRMAHRRGVNVLYYIAPKVWASRPKRAERLARWTDRVAVILPFEVDMLADAGVRAEYVGHPLLDRSPPEQDEARFRERWGLEPNRPLLAVLPGSRAQEIAHHLDLFAEAGRLVQSERPDVLPVISRARGIDAAALQGVGFPVVTDTPGLLRHARAGLVKSGTVTLEAALEGMPMVVAYRTSPVTWAIAKALLRTEHVSLPNLVTGRTLVPEYLQGGATAPALAEALLDLLDDESPRRVAQLDGFRRVRDELGPPGTAERVADLAFEVMGGSA